MGQFTEGDRVRVDIPDETDPDYARLHRRKGTVVEVFDDDAGQVTGDPRDSNLISVEMDDGTVEQVRWRDLRLLSKSGP